MSSGGGARTFQTPRGTQDILPDRWAWWDFVIDAARDTARSFGYERIETPTFEPTALFKRTAGEFTDVGKEMYALEERGGEVLSLRPEGTASVMRAYLQHGMQVFPQPVQLYYIGSMFRYERPQGGRLREHHQFGCEAIGSDDPLLDASMVELQAAFYQHAGLSDLAIHVNTIGDGACRPGFIDALMRYLRAHEDELCHESRDRISRNPLRTLDDKHEYCAAVLNGAPRTEDYLCDACRDHWERFRQGLDTLGIAVEIDPRLVRGLDYYTRSVWEFLPPSIESAQSTIGGGGRYDALSEAMGGPPVPGVGFSTGLERVMLNMEQQGVAIPDSPPVTVFIAPLGDDAALVALRLGHELREAGVAAEMTYGRRSLKAQLRHANRLGARFAILIGDDEVRDQKSTVRDLSSGDQAVVALSETAEWIAERLASR